MSLALRCTDLTRRFGDIVAVDKASLTIQKGTVLALLGPSGCGKTPLLRLIAGLDRPHQGSVEIDGRPVETESLHIPLNVGKSVLSSKTSLCSLTFR